MTETDHFFGISDPKLPYNQSLSQINFFHFRPLGGASEQIRAHMQKLSTYSESVTQN